MEPKLVPLRIPTGWSVALNKFREVNPEQFKHEDYEFCWEFDEDILHLKNEYRNRILDLGWYPSFNPKGIYRLLLIELHDDHDEQTESWEKPLIIFESRDIEETQRTIEHILIQVTEGLL
ncbi:hypothetical protein [Brevibacillus migulae]|uniref:hypothetical protein n=1 Tax=Brevibacillus migulae TaxID=1644114 RepID=UPI00106E068B|nr:hypothetical protein [Brevibacillus migulae]